MGLACIGLDLAGHTQSHLRVIGSSFVRSQNGNCRFDGRGKCRPISGAAHLFKQGLALCAGIIRIPFKTGHALPLFINRAGNGAAPRCQF